MSNNKAIGASKDDVCGLKDCAIVQKEKQDVTKINNGRDQEQKKKNVVKKNKPLDDSCQDEEYLLALKECNADILAKTEIIMMLKAKNERLRKDQTAKKCEMRALKDQVAKKEKENRKLRWDKDDIESYSNAKLLKFQDKNSQQVKLYKSKIFQKEQKIIELQTEKQKMRKQIDEYNSRDNKEASLSNEEKDPITQVEVEKLKKEVHKLKENVIEKEKENEKLCSEYDKYKINNEQTIENLEKQYMDTLLEKETKEISQEQKIQELENQNEIMRKQIDEYIMREEKAATSSIVEKDNDIRKSSLTEIQMLKKEVNKLKGKVLKQENNNEKLCKEYNKYKINTEQTIANLQKQFFSP